MPSGEHESPIALAKLDPGLVTWLLADWFDVKAYMTTATGSEYRSDLLREVDARGQAQGEARGEGRAVLTVLDARAVPVSTPIREQILACTDLALLDTWLRRAVTATAAEDVVRP